MPITPRLGFGSSSLLGWVKPELGRKASHRDVALVSFSLSPSVFLGVGIFVGSTGSPPQLYADNLECTATNDGSLLRAAKFTDRYFRAVGQEASPSKCVLLSTSKAVRKRVRCWAISAGYKSWGRKLGVRDLAERWREGGIGRY